MFAVQGWNVKSSLLKTQSLQPSEPAPGTTAPGENGANTTAGKSTKKRKRSSGKSKASDVNSTNLADLWETVIEGKEKPKELKAPKEKHGEKRQRIERDEKTDGSEAVVVAPGAEAAEGAISKDERPKKGKTLKEKKKEKKAALLESKDASEGQKVTPETIKAPIPAKPVAKLTPLQASMRQKLISARFRHLNQTLYTTPSAHSLQLFKENPEMFQEYHEGFRRQVEVWPENPVDGYALQIRQRGKLRRDKRGMGKEEKEEMKGSELSPLPRTDGKCHIADLGCGDAKLSEGLQKDLKKLNLAIYSYDLQNPSPLVTKADIANLPLADGSVDIAIFCLALMGTNWVDFIEEAFRILRWKGELWVAEIKSRFGRVSNQSKRVEHSVGNRQRKPDKKTLKKMEEDADDADLMVEVDGNEDKTGETDVSAFVEVLRKRGFVLQNEKAVDLSNRMFVKMHFVKGLTPIKGKGVPVPKGMAEMGLETWKKKPKAKFIDEEEVQVSSEASVLKPCVYKLR